MSRTLALSSGFLVITIIATLALTMKQKSASELKDLSLQPYKQLIPHTSKLMPNISVAIKNDNENYKPQPDDTVSLTAEVQLQAPAEKVSFQWIVPDGVSLLTAESGQISITDWQQVIKISAPIKNLTTENKKIFIKVSTTKSGRTDQITSAQYDTQNYLELLEEQENLQKRQAEYLQNQPTAPKKFK